jgi:hypothetical protein
MNPFDSAKTENGEMVFSYNHDDFSCYATIYYQSLIDIGYMGDNESGLSKFEAMERQKDNTDKQIHNHFAASEQTDTRKETTPQKGEFTKASIEKTKEEKEQETYKRKIVAEVEKVKEILVEPIKKDFERYGIEKGTFEKLGVGISIPLTESTAAHFSMEDNKIYLYPNVLNYFDTNPDISKISEDQKMGNFKEIIAHELVHYIRYNATGKETKWITDTEESMANAVAGVMFRSKDIITKEYDAQKMDFMVGSVERLPYMVGYAAAYSLLSMDEDKRVDLTKELILRKNSLKSLETITKLAIDSGIIEDENTIKLVRELPKIQHHIHKQNEDIPKEEIREIINSGNAYLVGLLAQNAKLTSYFKKVLANYDEDVVKILLIKNQKLGREEQLILERHSDDKVKSELASYWGLDPDVQLLLFNESNPAIVQNLAKNPGISQDVQEAIAKLDDPIASWYLIRNLKNLSGINVERISNLEAINDVLLNEKESSQASEKAFEYLSESKHYAVRLCNAVATVMREEERNDKSAIGYQLKLAEDNTPNVRVFIALSDRLSNEAFEKLLSDKDPVVLLALSENLYTTEQQRAEVKSVLERNDINPKDKELSDKLLSYQTDIEKVKRFLW